MRPGGGTVFALAGGGGLGAVQVGMLYALLEAGIRPDAVVGTSIGAINGAYLAGHADLQGMQALAEMWASVHRRDVFPLTVHNLVRGLRGKQDFICDPLGLRSVILRSRLGFSRLEDAPVPLYVVATDLEGSRAVVLSEGPVIEALMASTAIPGIFPAVRIGGRPLVDGGVLADVPVTQAEALGASSIYVLSTLPEQPSHRPSGALVAMQRAMDVASQSSARLAIETVRSRTQVHLLPVPGAAADISPLDLRRAHHLIDEAYATTAALISKHRVPASGTARRLVAA